MAESAANTVACEGTHRHDRERDQVLEALATLRAQLGQRTELRALNVVGQLVRKRDVEARIAQAMATLPESAGPLNSQGLVIKALAALDQRAPEYLEHLASYLGTLLWLEEQSL